MIAPLELAQQVAGRLGEIEGIQAVVLGGSHARGDAKPNSDIDLGIYYDPTHPPTLAALRTLAAELDDQHRAEAVTNFGEWGPWINGGAWLDIQGQRVDWLYCDLAKVEFEISECEAVGPKCIISRVTRMAFGIISTWAKCIIVGLCLNAMGRCRH